MNRPDPYRPARWLAGLTLIATALSISLTQIGMALTTLCGALLFLRSHLRDSSNGTGLVDLRRPGKYFTGPFARILLVGLLLFGWLALIGLYHRWRAGPAPGRPGELLDAGLFLFAPVFYLAARGAPPGDTILRRCLEILIWTLLLSGLAASFSEIRLARLFMGYGFEFSAANRPQHPLGVLNIPGLNLAVYRPVGFMNTRLTFAGLLILLLPFLAGESLIRILNWFRGETYDRKPSNILIRPLQTILALLVLGLNGTRSAWLGAAAGILFSIPILITIIFARDDERPVISRSWSPLARAVVIGLPAVIAVLLFLFLRNQPGETLANRLGRHTDFQRQIIWAGTGEIIAGRPLLGAGPGRFRQATLAWRREFLREEPQTMYWVQLTPSGHAHNDLLHLSAVGGLPAGLLFLALAALCLHAARSATRNGECWRLLFSGTAAFFVAGLFQCYFQDDEVVALFWMIIALAGARAR